MEAQLRVHEIQSVMVFSMKMSPIPPLYLQIYIYSVTNQASLLVSGLTNFANAL